MPGSPMAGPKKPLPWQGDFNLPSFSREFGGQPRWGQVVESAMSLPIYFTIQKFLSLKRSSTLPSSNWSGKPTLTFAGGSDSTFGKRNRTVPSVATAVEAVSIAQAQPIQVKRKKRRSGAFFAAGLGAAGLGGELVGAF